MDPRLRLFVAIDPDAGTRALLAEDLLGARRILSRGWRWVRAESIHLTLRFLGDTDAGKVEELISGLSRVAAGSPAFELALAKEWGAFPNARRPRVLWRALRGDLTALEGLAGSLEEWAREAGYAAEERAFRAHLTLARAARGERQAPFVAGELPASAGPAFRVEELVLFKSDLGPGGARYEALARAPLGGVGGKGEESS